MRRVTKIAERQQTAWTKNVNSEYIVECVMRATENGKKN